MSRQDYEWAIVGGGMLGLSLALRLQQAGLSVTLFEASKDIGGLAGAWNIGDFIWDKHYHVILQQDGALISLLRDIGISKDLVFKKARSGIYAGGKLYSISSAAEFLRFPYLSFADKMRLALTILGVSYNSNYLHFEKELCEVWLRRWSGSRVFERFWKPLLLSKLGGMYRESSAGFIWATIRRLYGARTTRSKGEVFGFVKGGYRAILQALESRLRQGGARFLLGHPVKRVRLSSNGVAVEPEGLSPQTFRHVVLTVPSPIIARICPELTKYELQRLRYTKYLGVVCASVLLSRPLAGFYVVALLDESLPFTGVIEMSALTGTEQFGGNTLVYLPRYVSSDDPMLFVPEEDIRASFLAGLMRMFPELRPNHVLAFRLSRQSHVMALPTLNRSSKVLPFRSSLPGVFVLNSSQIVAGTLNVNENVMLANRFAREVLSLEGLI